MQRIGVRVILQLHEVETIPSLLYNTEAWTLNKSERKLLDKMEIYAFKKMIGLPQTTPSAVIIMTLGTLFTSIRIDVKQLLYLHKILRKDETHWTRTTLEILKDYNIGWAKNLGEVLGN